jgi:type III pantothenate kinase
LHFKIRSMHLVTDIGNTRIKVAVFELDTIIEQNHFDKNIFFQSMEFFLKKYPKIQNWTLVSVSNIPDNEIKALENLFQIKPNILSNQSLFPFINKYATPQTVGLDRLVLAAGATLLFPNQNRLVIDAGTCITYDIINEKNEYLGGAISPGLQMRYRAMNDYTTKLPLLEASFPDHWIGNATQSSIHVGVVLGVLAEIDSYIERFLHSNKNFTIILTGGDTLFLAKRLKNTIFANSNFLLESMNAIFQYQTKND